MPYEKSPEQRAINWRKIIETALDMPGNVGNVYNRFYNYSYTNQALLWDRGACELFGQTADHALDANDFDRRLLLSIGSSADATCKVSRACSLTF